MTNFYLNSFFSSSSSLINPRTKLSVCMRVASTCIPEFSKNINRATSSYPFFIFSSLYKRDSSLNKENEKKGKKSSNPIFMLLIFHFHCLSTNRVRRKWGQNPSREKCEMRNEKNQLLHGCCFLPIQVPTLSVFLIRQGQGTFTCVL